MRVVSIINQKGGVGKTTTTRNMAYVLAEKFGKRVLVCDMDDSANLSDGFQQMPPETPDAGIVGMGLLLCDREVKVEEVICKTRFKNIDIIPCNATLADAKLEIERNQKYPGQVRLAKKLKRLKEGLPGYEYDFCLLDCKAGLDMLVINALYASDEAIVPTNVDNDAMNMVLRAIRNVEEIREENSELTLRGVLFTSIGVNSVDKTGVTSIASALPCPVFDTYIRYSIDVRKGRWAYLMCDEVRRGCNPALDYDNFVAEYLGEPPLHENGASRGKLKLAQK